MDLMLQAWLLYLAVHSAAGRSVGIGSHQSVKVVAGQDAILPCHLKPPFNVTTQMVEWKRDGKQVHLYRSKADNLDDQDKNFKKRTSLFHDEMDKGNFSLKLTNVTDLDVGNYTCHVRFKNKSIDVRIYNVTLIVGGGNNTGSTNTWSGGAIIGIVTATAVIIIIIAAIVFIAGVISGAFEFMGRC